MAFYRFHNITLEVKEKEQEIGERLPPLLQELSFVRIPESTDQPSLCLSVRMNDHGLKVPSLAREVFRMNRVCGREIGEDFYLTDDSSVLHLRPLRGYGDAHLSSTFFAKPLILQVDFLAFGLVKLLRPLGLYGLHAAGVITREGHGLLIVGESGSGKSTLALGLIRQGWGYVSDEVVLLHLQPDRVEALALCKGFYISTSRVTAYADLPLGEEIADNFGGQKRRVGIEDTWPTQYMPSCIPCVLLFSRIVPQEHSSLLPLNRLTALKHLLMQSGPQWFDRGTMAEHLEALKRLMQQATIYELRAGRDLYHNPLTLVRLIAEADGEKRWPGL